MIGQLVAYRAFVERGDARFLVFADRADYVDRIPYPVSASAMTGRKSLSAIPDSPIPVLWNVEKR